MCTVSMVIDDSRDRWGERYPWIQPRNPIMWPPPAPTRDEVDALRREVEDLRRLIERAKAYDAAKGEPDCEMEEKVEFVKRIAELVGVDLEDLLA